MLHEAAFERVERADVVAHVQLQILVLGAGAEVALDVAAQVQPGAAPVARGEQRHLDVGEVRIVARVQLAVASPAEAAPGPPRRRRV